MGKETFLLVSLEEEKAQKLARVISNESCRKMLDELANKSCTETELAQKLNIPLPTVHYNLKHLVSAGLVKAGEFHYSPKGREVNHYSITNKFVIITPKRPDENVMNRLKRLITTFVIVGGFGLAYHLYNKGIGRITALSLTQMKAAPMMENALLRAPAAAESAVETASQAEPNFLLWFMAISLLTIAVYVIADYAWKKIEK